MTGIDVLQNPATNKNTDRPSLMARALQSGARGSVFLPDMAQNAGIRTGDMLANLLGSKMPDATNKDFNPEERSLVQSGVLNPNMPEANSYAEKFADYAGAGIGSLMPLLGLKGGVQSLLGSIPKAASTAGMVAAPAAIGPKVDEWSGHNPLITIPTQILASILGGKVAGGLAKPFSSPEPLPEYTAAQNAYIENPDAPHTKDLIARQLDLAKKDPKSADILDQIGKNQEKNIVSNMTPENPISGENIAQNIKNTTNDLIGKRSADYQAADAQLMANPQKVDATPTLNLIQEMRSRAASGGNLEKALNQAEALVTANSDNPQAVMNAKTSLQKLANYSPELSLDSQESAAIKKIASQYGQDIDQAMPGYTDMNKNYSEQTKNLHGIIDGLGGNVVAAGETAPSSIPRRIFEKVDPALSGQMKGVLPEDIYNQAADSYLGDVLQRAQTNPTKNVFNNSSQMYKMGEILEKNYPVLQETLPPAQLAKVDQAMKDIDVSNLGRPRNDYTVDARRGYAVGDEVKGLGADFKSGSWINPMTYMRMAQKPFFRNEMVTGTSPMGQIGNAIGRTAIKGSAIAAMDQPQMSPTNQNPGVSQNQPIANEGPLLPPSTMQSQQQTQQNMGSSAIDDLMKQYGSGNVQKPVQNGQSTTAIDDLIKQYGLNNSAQIAPPPSQSKIPLPDNVVDYVSKELKKGNTDVLYDPVSSYDKFKSSMAPDSPAFMGKVKNIIASRESAGSGDYGAQAPNSSAAGKYQFIDSTRNNIMPGVSREDFLNSPDKQEEAMNKLILANEQTFKNKGIDPNSVPPNQLAGMLMAAHLRGPQAGINAYKDASYQGVPDANGTLPRSYYDYASSSFDSGKFDPTPDFKTMSTDDLLNYGQKMLQISPQPSNDSMQT